ncbi:PQQ-dependent sugar dehydrogenase [Nocardioides sp. GY 10127]|uniref:PQQ-dependent sugar dehydrogenase n=1 Tax=Nocardioides sp. GY 10127 TaxID=2569762 RepID=UPI0010A92C21|nr:PQQ-dependent sugar dehydrogenase [Nocardioides sp. GY 10127]TIC82601.1 PQQ-dependent sugar dehydrogenase [Nocardioides sp. GY 10127]
MRPTRPDPARAALSRSALSRSALLRAAGGLGLGVAAAEALAACSFDTGSTTGPSGEASGATTTVTASPSPSDSAGGSASSTPSRTPTSDPTSTSRSRAVPRTVDVRVGRTLATDLNVPWGIAFLPDGSALVGSRDTAHVHRITPEGRRRSVGTVPGVVSNVAELGEAGLLGLALHPDYPRRPWLYAYRSTASGNQVVRMRYRGGRLGRPHVLLDGINSSIHHNGGALAFGPDGHLYVGTGDAEVSSDAQDTASLNGKILRIAEDGSVPRGNPWRNPVWTIGHRNVEGLAFDGSTLWASEFGDKTADELNRVVGGRNYGWPYVEGSDGRGGYRDPLTQWATDDASPSGIAVAAGRAWLATLQGQCVYAVVLRGPRKGHVEKYLAGRYGRLRLVAAAPDGSLWLGSSNTDGRTTPSAGDDRLVRLRLVT